MCTSKSHWKPWKDAKYYFGLKVLIKFDNEHIEDAVIVKDTEGDPYYILFDGENLPFDPMEFMFIPE